MFEKTYRENTIIEKKHNIDKEEIAQTHTKTEEDIHTPTVQGIKKVINWQKAIKVMEKI